MSPFTDRELAALDRVAGARDHRESFAAAHPEFSSMDYFNAALCAQARALVGTSNALIRADLKARARRFTGEAITGFGSFDDEPEDRPDRFYQQDAEAA
jgi:hypothetical protein